MIFQSFAKDSLLNELVRRISVPDFEENQITRKARNVILSKTKDDRPFAQEIAVENEKQHLACRWSLPHAQFDSPGETLGFDLLLKWQLLQYVFPVLRFAKGNIDRGPFDRIARIRLVDLCQLQPVVCVRLEASDHLDEELKGEKRTVRQSRITEEKFPFGVSNAGGLNISFVAVCQEWMRWTWTASRSRRFE